MDSAISGLSSARCTAGLGAAESAAAGSTVAEPGASGPSSDRAAPPPPWAAAILVRSPLRYRKSLVRACALRAGAILWPRPGDRKWWGRGSAVYGLGPSLCSLSLGFMAPCSGCGPGGEGLQIEGGRKERAELSNEGSS